MFADLLLAALDAERARCGSLGVRFEAIWPGWEETEDLLRRGGWDVEMKRSRVLRIIPARHLSGQIAAVDPDIAWIERQTELAWTEDAPMRFTAHAYPSTSPDRDIFTFWTQDEVSFAVFEGSTEATARFRAAAAVVVANRSVEVSFEGQRSSAARQRDGQLV